MPCRTFGILPSKIDGEASSNGAIAAVLKNISYLSHKQSHSELSLKKNILQQL